MTSSTPANEIGSNDSTATVTIEDETGPYSYSWNTIPIQTTPMAINLPSITYTVSITDQNDCTTVINVNVDNTPRTLFPDRLTNFSLIPNPTKAATQAHLQFNEPSNWQLQLSNTFG